MAFGAVLDPNVLVERALCDTLLRLAQLELFDPYWSQRILEEMIERLVAKQHATREAASHRAHLMNQAFEAAQVPDAGIDRLEPTMTNVEHGRHVLAAAVASPAQVIVTFDLADFAHEACDPFGIEPRHPDEFLMNQYDLAPTGVGTAIRQQAADLSASKAPVDDVLSSLQGSVPTFAATVARALR